MYTIRRKKTNRRKKSKKSRKSKRKYIKKQKGGLSAYSSYTLQDIDEEEPGRFEYNTFHDMIQIVDKKYNKRYLFRKGKKFSVLIDEVNNKYYAFDNNGLQLEEGSIGAEHIKDIFKNESRIIPLFKADIMIHTLNDNKGCYTPFNLDVVKAKIDDLNKILKKKCSNLELQIDNYYNLQGNISVFHPMDEMVICLYYKGNCISSVILEIRNDIVTIDSRTDENFQGNKFNKLLRCISVIISATLICNENGGAFTTLRSIPANPISAWLLISNFNTIIRKDNYSIDEDYEKEFMKLKSENTELSDNEINKKLIFDKKYRFMGIDVPLDAENVEKAERIFNELDIICPP